VVRPRSSRPAEKCEPFERIVGSERQLHVVEEGLGGGVEPLLECQRRHRVERECVDAHAGVAVRAAAQPHRPLLLLQRVLGG
jgi:hypothetical protein